MGGSKDTGELSGMADAGAVQATGHTESAPSTTLVAEKEAIAASASSAEMRPSAESVSARAQPALVTPGKSALPAQRNFTLRLGELAIFLTAVVGAVALGLGISSYFVSHPYVLAYLAAYGAFRFADLLVREEAALRTDREGFARRIAYQLPILVLFAAAPFERTYIYGAEGPQWSAALGLLIELAGLWLALGARIQLGFFTQPSKDGESPFDAAESRNRGLTGSHANPAGLVRSGMYRYIRHPIQLGEFLVLIAWPLEYGAPVTEALMLIIGALVVYRRIRREETELLAIHGDRYAQYMRETDRVLPNVW